MRVLLLGGTKFLGRHLAEAALERNHEVTLFNRGLTNPGLFGEAEQLVGDRDGRLEALAGRTWDAVIDTSGYVPRIVKQSARLLAEAAGAYCFISSVSAYGDFSAPDMNEDSPLATVVDETTEEVSAHYGALKALCEREVREAFGERALIVRPGLIVGPHDPSDRFTYWPLRFAEGGDVLVPGQADRPIQIIDARDLSEWIVRLLERKAGGTYNAISPANGLTMGMLAESCSRFSGAPARAVWADGGFLERQGEGEWIELPLWIHESSGMPGFMTNSSERAVREGLMFRPLDDTVRDTLEWARGRFPEQPLRAGMSREREAELLAAWRSGEAARKA